MTILFSKALHRVCVEILNNSRWANSLGQGWAKFFFSMGLSQNSVLCDGLVTLPPQKKQPHAK